MAIKVSGTTVIDDSRSVTNLTKVIVPTYSSAPTGSAGAVYLNTTDGKLYGYTTEWVLV